MKLASRTLIYLLFAGCAFAGCVAVFVPPALTSPVDEPRAEWLGPVAAAISPDGRTLFVANADARSVVVVDTAGRKVIGSIAVPATPTAVALSGGGELLYVACAAAKSQVCAIDVASRKIVATFPAGHTAAGLAVSPDGRRLYVCNRFDNDVSVLDLTTGKEIARWPMVREPAGAVVSPDGRRLFVINQLPLARADSGDVAAVVSVVDTDTAGPPKPAASVRLPNGSSSVRGICRSPDGRWVYVTHILSRYLAPTTQLERGWMNTNALSIVDANEKTLLATVLLDDVERGAANPWGVAVTADGRQLCVAHAGTSELSILDAVGLHERLKKPGATPDPKKPQKPKVAPDLAPAPDTADDLSFLVGLRRRVPLGGVGAQAVAVAGRTAYVAEFFTDSLAVVDLASGTVDPIPLAPRPTLTSARRGRMLFESAKLCFQNWQSCESCHPGARADGLNWDLMNDGIGNPKNTRNMLLSQQSGPVMALGVRENTLAAVRAGIAHIQFADRPERDATDVEAYIRSLEPAPSPRLVDGRLSAAAERGKQIFLDPKTNCLQCHPAPHYSDKLMHDVGTATALERAPNGFLTPGLREAWRTAPYLHDGRYLTVKQLLVEGRHGAKNGNLASLTEQQIDDLVEFVLSL